MTESDRADLIHRHRDDGQASRHANARPVTHGNLTTPPPCPAAALKANDLAAKCLSTPVPVPTAKPRFLSGTADAIRNTKEIKEHSHLGMPARERSPRMVSQVVSRSRWALVRRATTKS